MFFLNALSGDIKDQLTSREEASDLDHLIFLAIRVDNRLRERRRERGQHSASTSSVEPPAAPHPLSFPVPPRNEQTRSPEPMQIGRTHLSSRSGNAVCAPELVSIVGCQVISGLDVLPSREKNGLARNPRDPGEPLP